MKRKLEIALAVGAALKIFAASAEQVPTHFAEFKTVSINGASGNLIVSNGTFRLTNSVANDSGMYFAFQPFSGNGQVTARILRSNRSPIKAGVLFRQTTNSISPYGGTFLTGSNTVFERLLSTNEPTTVTVRTNEIVEWLRVVREGNAFSGFYSSNGTDWIQFSADSIEAPSDIFAGLIVGGGGEAVFDKVQMTSAYLASPSNNSTFVVPTNILLKANVTTFGKVPGRVEFFAEADKIGETTNFPYTIIWSNALAGIHSLTAKITDASGADFFTEPVNCEIKLPPASAKFIRVDDVTRGDWIGKYGAEGFHIIQHATNYPVYAEVTSSGHKSALVLYDSNNPGALQFTNKADRIAAHWHSYTNMTVNISLLDGRPHQVAIYCQDWGSDNVRIQSIEVLDANSRSVLDERRVASFSNGKYLVWNIQGAVKFRITTVFSQAVISGIFFDPKRAGTLNE